MPPIEVAREKREMRMRVRHRLSFVRVGAAEKPRGEAQLVLDELLLVLALEKKADHRIDEQTIVEIAKDDPKRGLATHVFVEAHAKDLSKELPTRRRCPTGMRRVLVFVCAAFASACAAAEPEPRLTASLPVIEKPPPKTIYGVDPPVPREATYGDQLTPPPAPASTWGCGETSGMTSIVALRSQMRACYTKSLNTDPTRSGKVVFRLEIDGAGRATRVSIESSTVGDKELERCLASTFERGSYPCVSGMVTVPVMFAPP